MRQNLIKSVFYVLLATTLSSCASTSKDASDKVKSYYSINSDLDKISVKDTSLINLVNFYKCQLDSDMNTVISIAKKDLTTDRPEGLLSNFIADAMLDIGRKYCVDNNFNYSVDLALMNMGGIRVSLYKGEITKGRVYEMLPFENKLVIVGLEGKDLVEILQRVAYLGGEGLSGVSMGIKDHKAVNILIGGEPVDFSKIYHIITIDFLIHGGDGFTMFKERKTLRHTHKLLRSEIIKYMADMYERGESLSAKKSGRIYNVE